MEPPDVDHGVTGWDAVRERAAKLGPPPKRLPGETDEQLGARLAAWCTGFAELVNDPERQQLVREACGSGGPIIRDIGDGNPQKITPDQMVAELRMLAARAIVIPEPVPRSRPRSRHARPSARSRSSGDDDPLPEPLARLRSSAQSSPEGRSWTRGS